MTAPCRDCPDRAACDVRRKNRLEYRKVSDYTIDQCLKNKKAMGK